MTVCIRIPYNRSDVPRIRAELVDQLGLLLNAKLKKGFVLVLDNAAECKSSWLFANNFNVSSLAAVLNQLKDFLDALEIEGASTTVNVTFTTRSPLEGDEQTIAMITDLDKGMSGANAKVWEGHLETFAGSSGVSLLIKN